MTTQFRTHLRPQIFIGIVFYTNILCFEGASSSCRVANLKLPINQHIIISVNYMVVYFFCNQVIAAEGEMNASRALKEAAEVIAESPQALQLRYLQTLSAISAEKNSTIIFPLPISMLNALKGSS